MCTICCWTFHDIEKRDHWRQAAMNLEMVTMCFSIIMESVASMAKPITAQYLQDALPGTTWSTHCNLLMQAWCRYNLNPRIQSICSDSKLWWGGLVRWFLQPLVCVTTLVMCRIERYGCRAGYWQTQCILVSGQLSANGGIDDQWESKWQEES